MTNEQRFSCPWSKVTLISTILVIGIVLAIFISVVPKAIWSLDHGGSLANLVVVIIIPMPILLFVCLLFAPMSYSITNEALSVNRLGPNVVIACSDLADAQPIERGEFSGTIRVFGVGGFCGSFGLFRNKKLGTFKAYMTNSKTLVLVKLTNGKKIVLSPDRPDEFVKAIKKAANI